MKKRRKKKQKNREREQEDWVKEGKKKRSIDKKRERKTGSRRSHSSFVSSDSWCKRLWDTTQAWSYFWWSKIAIKWLPVAGRELEEGATSWCGALSFKSSSCHPPSLPFPSHPIFGTLEQRHGSTDTKGHSLPVPVQQFGMGLLIHSKSATDPTWHQKQRAAISIVPAALLSLCEVNQSCLAGCMTSKDQGQDAAFPPFHQCTTPIIRFESLKVSTTCFVLLHSDLFKNAFKIPKVEGCNQFVGYKTRRRSSWLCSRSINL